jgi:hypothetical protein
MLPVYRMRSILTLRARGDNVERKTEKEEKVLGDMASVKYADFPGNFSYAGQDIMDC